MRHFYKSLVLPIIFLINFNTVVFAQTVKDEVMKPIHLLFEGMEKADTSLFKDIFAKNVIMKVVSEKS